MLYVISAYEFAYMNDEFPVLKYIANYTWVGIFIILYFFDSLWFVSKWLAWEFIKYRQFH